MTSWPITFLEVVHDRKRYYCLSETYNRDYCVECSLDLHSPPYLLPYAAFNSEDSVPTIFFAIRGPGNLWEREIKVVNGSDVRGEIAKGSSTIKANSYQKVYDISMSQIDSVRYVTSAINVTMNAFFKDGDEFINISGENFEKTLKDLGFKRKIRKEKLEALKSQAGMAFFIFDKNNKVFTVFESDHKFDFTFLKRLPQDRSLQVFESFAKFTGRFSVELNQGVFDDIFQIPNLPNGSTMAYRMGSLRETHTRYKKKYSAYERTLCEYILKLVRTPNTNIQLHIIDVPEEHGYLKVWYADDGTNSQKVDIHFYPKNRPKNFDSYYGIDRQTKLLLDENNLTEAIGLKNSSLNSIVSKLRDRNGIIRPTVLTLLSKQSNLILFSASPDKVVFLQPENQGYSFYFIQPGTEKPDIRENQLILLNSVNLGYKGTPYHYSKHVSEHRALYDKIRNLIFDDVTATVYLEDDPNQPDKIRAIFFYGLDARKMGILIEEGDEVIDLRYTQTVAEMQRHVNHIRGSSIQSSTGIYTPYTH